MRVCVNIFCVCGEEVVRSSNCHACAQSSVSALQMLKFSHRQYISNSRTIKAAVSVALFIVQHVVVIIIIVCSE